VLASAYLKLTRLSATYSNLENHPRLIRLTQPHGAQKIHLDPKTGLPSVREATLVGMPELSESEDPKAMEPGELLLRAVVKLLIAACGS
jgi:hypothetical protein